MTSMSNRPELSLSHSDLVTPPAVHRQISAAAPPSNGVIAGCRISAQDPPSAMVDVSSGTVRTASTDFAVTAGTFTLTGAHTSLPRIDLVVIDENGAKQTRTGQAANPPAFPATLDADDVILAAIYTLPRPDGAARVTAGMIVPGVLLEQDANSELVWRNTARFNTSGVGIRGVDPGTVVGRIDQSGSLWGGTNEFVTDITEGIKGEMPDFLYSTRAERLYTHSVRLADLSDPADLNLVRFGPEGLGDYGDEGLSDAYLLGNLGGGLGVGQVRMTPVRQVYKGYVAFTADAATDVCTATAHGRVGGDKMWVQEFAGNEMIAHTWVYLIAINPNTFKLAAEPDGSPIDLATGSGILLSPGVRGVKASRPGGGGPTLTSSGPPIQVTDKRLICRSTGASPLEFGRVYYTRNFQAGSPPTFEVSENDGGIALVFGAGGGPIFFDAVGTGARDEDSGAIVVFETAEDDVPRQLTDVADGADRTAGSQLRVRLARANQRMPADVMRFNQSGELELGLGGVGTAGSVVTIGGFDGRNTRHTIETSHGQITGGSFTLYFFGPPPPSPGFHEPLDSISAKKTAAIQFDVNGEVAAPAVQTALEALAAIGSGNVVASGGPLPDEPIEVEFIGALAKTNITRLGLTATLTGTDTPQLRAVAIESGLPADSDKPLLSVRDQANGPVRTSPYLEARDRDDTLMAEVSGTGALSVQPGSGRHFGAGMHFSDVLALQEPKLWWRLGEAFGSVAADRSGNGLPGTYTGGLALGVNGIPTEVGFDTAVDLLGVDGRVQTSAYIPWANGTVRTFGGWAWRDTNTTVDAILGGSLGTSPSLRIDSGGGNVLFRPKDNTAGAGNEASWAAAWPGTGQWVHWVLVFDEPANTVELFVNGTSKGAVTSITGQYDASPGDLRIGTKAGANAPFDGKMDEFAVWERALSPLEIAIQYSTGTVARSEILLGDRADTSVARTGAGIVKLGEVLHMSERVADPPAPATNDVYIFAKDNGSGKTGLYARFSSGAVQQIALQP